MTIKDDINWHNIRTHNGSQYGGFEELCTQLARSEKPRIPKATKFRRLGNPDGGIECYWEDSDGNKYGWQAKYYPANQNPDKYYLKNVRWGDITKSIKTALKEHPTLTHYYVCVPKDLTLNTDKTWKRQVIKWKALAKSKRGKEVEFIWWGASELSDRLIQTEHAGRFLYWFRQYRFSDKWFKDNIDISAKTAGPRYTPEVHVKLPIARELEKLIRTDHYINEIRSYAKDIQRERRSLQQLIFYSSSPDLKRFTYRLLNLLLTILVQLTALKVEPIGEFTFQNIYKSAQHTISAINEFMEYLSQWTSEHKDPLFDQFRDQITRTLTILESVLDKTDTEDTQLIIVKGAAGTGKTHLLCDIAQKRVDNGLPTVLLMGQRFTSDNELWAQAREHLDLTEEVSMKEFVGALEAAGQAKGCRTLLMIDAVDKGREHTIWLAHLVPFLARINISPWITVVLSVRSADKDAVIPKEIQNRAVPQEHRGFEGKESDAIQTFFPHYGLKLPSTPILNQEFSNPYFLKVFCRASTGLSEQIQPGKLYGISKVFESYLVAVNEELVERLGCDPNENYVRAALMEIAQHIVGGDLISKYKQGLDRKIVKDIVDQFLPGRNYGRSLYHGMVSEGIFIEDLPAGTQGIVSIYYKRLADHIVADFLLQKYLDKDNPEEAFAKGGGLAFLFDKKQGELDGLLEALSIQIPEQARKELVELVPSLLEREDVRAAFIQSVYLRRPNAITKVTEELLEVVRDETIEDSIRLARELKGQV